MLRNSSKRTEQGTPGRGSRSLGLVSGRSGLPQNVLLGVCIFSRGLAYNKCPKHICQMPCKAALVSRRRMDFSGVLRPGMEMNSELLVSYPQAEGEESRTIAYF